MLGKGGHGCGGPRTYDGWYGKLLFDPSPDYEPTIADIHTQPNDESGAPVGRVLHVGTGKPRLLVAVADTCTGPRAYAGLTSSYYEETTDGYRRLTDTAWEEQLQAGRASSVMPWADDFTVRAAKTARGATSRPT